MTTATRALMMVGGGAFTALADQWSKDRVFACMFPGQSHEWIDGILWATPSINRGAAFSFLHSAEHGNTILLILSGVLLILLSWMGLKSYRKAPVAAFALILGGAVGNMIDRLGEQAGVRDFIDLRWWPIFNVADIAISLGVGILLVWSLFQKSANEPEPVSAPSAKSSD